MASHPLLDQLDMVLGDHVPREPVSFAGEWSNASRRTYASETQLGTAAGPFAEVVDFRWRGTLTGARPIGGIAFLVTAGNLHWVKAPEISSTLSVHISFHAYSDYKADRATFTAGIAGTCLPGVSVSVRSDSAESCLVEQRVLKTGQVSCLAQADSAGFFMLLFQRGLLKVGRKRLWHVRDKISSSLPAGIRELLTHRRTGSVLSGA